MSLNEKTEKMCRVCLSTDETYSDLIPLFSGGCATSQVPKKMMNISKIFMHKQDGLPSMICLKCVFLVKVTDCFKKQIRLADKELRNIWIQSKDTEETTTDVKTAVDSSDSEIEDLAYNPEYISDEIKTEVENAFRRKHEMIRNKEYQVMSSFLKNLGKKRFFPSNSIKQEIVKSETSDESIVNNSSEFNSVENVHTSDKKLAGEFQENGMDQSNMHDTGEIKTETVETEKPADDSEQQTTEETVDFYNTESSNIAQPEAQPNMDLENVNPNIIVISDSSDDAGARFGGKPIRPREKLELFRRGEKRKVNAPLQPIVSEMPKIRVIKLNESLQNVKARKTQAKGDPRMYFLCTSCNVRLQSVAAVLLHHNQVHSPNKNSLHCRMCNKIFPTKNQLLEHFNRHEETHLFRCSYCPNEFVLKDNLTKHMLNHTKQIKPQEAKCNKRMRMSDENSTGEMKIEETTENGV